MKKIRTSLLLVASALCMTAMTGCGNKKGEERKNPAELKVGLILLHPAASSTYDKNFREAFEAAQQKLGFQAVIKENIDESDECQTTAEEMAEQGCDIVFADSASFFTAASTAFWIPFFTIIGLAPAATFFKPSLTSA